MGDDRMKWKSVIYHSIFIFFSFYSIKELIGWQFNWIDKNRTEWKMIEWNGRYYNVIKGCGTTVDDMIQHPFGQRPRRGRSPVEHRGNLSVRTSIRPSVRPPPQPHPQGFVSFGAQIQTVWPKSRQNGLIPGKMAQIQAKWAKSG